MFASLKKAITALRPAAQFEGVVSGHPWQLREGPSTRDYIVGRELLGRCELGISDDVSVVLMNRHLKESMERSAYERYIDSEQTLASTGLPEELRWISIYPEVRWPQLPREFWRRWSVLSSERPHATAWIDPALADLLMDWPAQVTPEVPVLLMLLRGRVYLRVQFEPRSSVLARHAAELFSHACGVAAREWGEDGVAALAKR